MWVFSQDESRFGLLTVRRRRLTACGVQPVGSIQHVFEWFYVYGAVAHTTGERFFLELPYLNAENFQLFNDLFSQTFPDSLNLLLLDHSGAHTAHQPTLPAHVRLVYLRPYGPELNSIERTAATAKTPGLAPISDARCPTRPSGHAPPGL